MHHMIWSLLREQSYQTWTWTCFQFTWITVQPWSLWEGKTRLVFQDRIDFGQFNKSKHQHLMKILAAAPSKFIRDSNKTSTYESMSHYLSPIYQVVYHSISTVETFNHSPYKNAGEDPRRRQPRTSASWAVCQDFARRNWWCVSASTRLKGG